MSDTEIETVAYMLGYSYATLESILIATSLIEARARAAFAIEELLDSGVDIPAKDKRELRAAIASFDASLAVDESLDGLTDAVRQVGDAAEATTQAIHDREEKKR